MTARQRHILKVALHLLQRYLNSSELLKVEMQLTDVGEQHLHILPEEVQEAIEMLGK